MDVVSAYREVTSPCQGLAGSSGKPPSIEVIESLASEFQTMLTATAIRYVSLRGERCAVVCSTNGEVSWVWPSPEFHY
jgi:hypothetical protein